MIEQKMSPVGVSVQQFGFIGAPRVPSVIAAAITGKAQAIQPAERARKELATTQAEAFGRCAGRFSSVGQPCCLIFSWRSLEGLTVKSIWTMDERFWKCLPSPSANEL